MSAKHLTTKLGIHVSNRFSKPNIFFFIFRIFKLNILRIIYFEFELISHSTEIDISSKRFGLENLIDEKDMYPYLHREMFGRHMTRDICRTYILLGFLPQDLFVQ